MGSSKYDPSFYKGGHLVPFTKNVKVRSYQALAGACYRYVIEYYDDRGNLYAYKHSPSDRNYRLEQDSIDAAFDLLGVVHKQVS